MNDRYDKLLAAGLRKITPESGEPVYLVVIDEYAYFSATVGDKTNSKPSSPRSPATWSPAAGRPGSSSSWPPSGHPTRSSTHPCATCSATGGPSAAPPTHPQTPCSATAGPARATPPPSIDPLARGVSWLLSETGVPRRVKAAYLSDRHITDLAALAVQLRRKDAA